MLSTRIFKPGDYEQDNIEKEITVVYANGKVPFEKLPENMKRIVKNKTKNTVIYVGDICE